MNTRERFCAIMQFEPFDRLPILEWANWWKLTIERWRGEGLPAEAGDRYEICRHFGLDIYRNVGFSPQARDCPKPPGHGMGIIGTEKEYEAILPCLYPSGVLDYERLDEWSREQERGESVLRLSLPGFFWFPRTLLGIERHLYAFYDQPDLIRRINRDLAGWMLGVIEDLCRVCAPDFMHFSEDLSYNKGPMLSRQLFDSFLRPCYDRVVPELRRRGIIVFVDSDGDVAEPARWFSEAGIEGILPLERQAGVDISSLRAEHPRMRFIGHFDKMVMSRGREAMRSEFERLLPTAARGGFLVGCDHQTPPGVSYAQYLDYLDLFREYAARAGSMSQELLRNDHAGAHLSPGTPNPGSANKNPPAKGE